LKGLFFFSQNYTQSEATMSAIPHKKNLQGGKNHKRQSNKERSGPRKNRELTVAFIEDIAEGETIDGLTIARVQKVLGGATMDLLSVDGKSIKASLKGSLRSSAGAARRQDNPIAVFPGTFVLLQNETHGSKIVGVLNRPQVKVIEEYFTGAPRGFFNLTGAIDEEDAGFDWDDEEVDVENV
jgi:hypothetical protein